MSFDFDKPFNIESFEFFVQELSKRKKSIAPKASSPSPATRAAPSSTA